MQIFDVESMGDEESPNTHLKERLRCHLELSTSMKIHACVPVKQAYSHEAKEEVKFVRNSVGCGKA